MAAATVFVAVGTCNLTDRIDRRCDGVARIGWVDRREGAFAPQEGVIPLVGVNVVTHDLAGVVDVIRLSGRRARRIKLDESAPVPKEGMVGRIPPRADQIPADDLTSVVDRGQCRCIGARKRRLDVDEDLRCGLGGRGRSRGEQASERGTTLGSRCSHPHAESNPFDDCLRDFPQTSGRHISLLPWARIGVRPTRLTSKGRPPGRSPNPVSENPPAATGVANDQNRSIGG